MTHTIIIHHITTSKRTQNSKYSTMNKAILRISSSNTTLTIITTHTTRTITITITALRIFSHKTIHMQAVRWTKIIRYSVIPRKIMSMSIITIIWLIRIAITMRGDRRRILMLGRSTQRRIDSLWVWMCSTRSIYYHPLRESNNRRSKHNNINSNCWIKNLKLLIHSTIPVEKRPLY